MKGDHIAGRFMRKYRSEWLNYRTNAFQWAAEKGVHQEIQIAGAPKNNMQMQYAGQILDALPGHESTALVLADEQLLPMAMNALPETVGSLNITMGYPLRDVAPGVLFDRLFRLHLNQQKFDKEDEQLWYFKDIVSLLNHPLLNRLCEDAPHRLTTGIAKANLIFLHKKNLENMLEDRDLRNLQPFLSFLEPYQDSTEFIGRFIQLINALRDLVHDLEREYLYRFYQIFQQLDNLNRKYGYLDDMETLSSLFFQLLRYEKLSFEGEPLAGLQLMGMLETRALDFDTVIITSANEGILPKGKHEVSFIPFDAKIHFGLPTYHDKDAIYAYHFYRLIHRAKKVYLVYNTETDGYGSGEKSRFLKELELNRTDCMSSHITPQWATGDDQPLEIRKTDSLLARIQKKMASGISPSTLALYKWNPIKFFEQVVLGVEEDESVEETIASRTLGSVIHEVLEKLYSPICGNVLTKEDLADMQTRIPVTLKEAFETYYRGGAINGGKNKLTFEIAKSYILRFLKQEMKLIAEGNTLRILSVEKKYEAEIPIEIIGLPVVLKGTVDRIDELNGTIRILDYKTGSVKPGELNLKQMDDLHTESYTSKALQLLTYAYLFKSNEKQVAQKITVGLISFRKLNQEAGMLTLPVNFEDRKDISDVVLESYLKTLTKLIHEILDPEIPFTEPDT
jgi:RecB family exonuclease